MNTNPWNQSPAQIAKEKKEEQRINRTFRIKKTLIRTRPTTKTL